MSDEESDEIVVTGRRGGRGSPVQRFSIDIDTGGTFDGLIDGLPARLRALLVNETDFDVDETLTPKQKEIVVKAIEGLADHPLFGEAFKQLLAKGADININATTRLSDTFGVVGATIGLEPNLTVAQGAKINIYVLMVRYGEPVSDRAFAETVVHELIHALGVPEFSARLHAPNSLFDREITNDLFRGYNFEAPPSSSAAQETIIRIGAGPNLFGTSERDVLAASDRADTIVPGAGGDLVYSGAGDDSIQITTGGNPDLIADDSGNDRIVLPVSVNPSSVTTRWSSGGEDLILLVNGTPEAIIQNAQSGGAVEAVQIGATLYPINAFSTASNAPPADQSRVIEYFGGFGGGYVGSAATTDSNNDALGYELVSVSGEFADRPWQVNASTGVIEAQFFKPDQQGSQFTTLIVRVSDTIDVVDQEIIVRWAYSLEQNPEF